MYICVYCIVIRGPQVHQSLTGEFDLYATAERRNVLPQLNVHLRCVWYCFNSRARWCKGWRWEECRIIRFDTNTATGKDID